MSWAIELIVSICVGVLHIQQEDAVNRGRSKKNETITIQIIKTRNQRGQHQIANEDIELTERRECFVPWNSQIRNNTTYHVYVFGVIDLSYTRYDTHWRHDYKLLSISTRCLNWLKVQSRNETYTAMQTTKIEGKRVHFQSLQVAGY